MNRLLTAALLLAPLAAAAQPSPPAPDPQMQAAQQMIIELTGQTLNYRTQAIALQRQVDDLQKQLAAAKAPAAPEPAK